MKEKREQVLNSKRRKIKEARLVVVAELLTKGYSYQQIADEVSTRLDLDKYSKTLAWKDAQYLFAQWREQRLNDTEEAVAFALERNRQHYQETREEWERSRKDRTRINHERKGVPVKGGLPGGGPKEDKIVTIETKEKRIVDLGEGDPRYMDLMIKLEDQRAKLLGIYKENHEISGPGGGPLLGTIFDGDLSKLSNEERAALLDIARKVGQ